MAIPVMPLQPGQDPGVHQANPRNLRAAIDAGDFAALSDAVVDVRTTLRIRGCALGRSQEMLTLLSQAFGGEEAQRPAVRAPKHLQAYEFGPNTWHPGRANPPSFSDEYFVEFWFVGFPEGQRPPDAQLIAQFTAAFPDAGVDWRDALRRTGPPSGDLASTETRTRTYIYTYTFFPIPTSAQALTHIVQALDGFADAQNIQETARMDNPDGTKTIDFDYEQHGNAMQGTVNVGAPTSTAQRLNFFRQQPNLQADLARVELTVDDYSWQFIIDTSPDVEGPMHGLVHALVGTGRRTILRAQRELREPDPDNPARTRRLRPPVTDLTHFGEEVPARPAARPLGDNVLP